MKNVFVILGNKSKEKFSKFSIISSKTHIPKVKNIINNFIFYDKYKIKYISV